MGRRQWASALLLGIALLAPAACTSSTAPSGPSAGPPPASPSPSGTATAPAQPASGATASPSSMPGPVPTPDPLEGWTLEQQVGQLFMVGVDTHAQQASAWAAVRERHVGNVFLAGRSQADTQAVLNLVESFTDLVGPGTTHGAPMLVATDQEGGAVQVLQGPGFSAIPSALDQSTWEAGALRDAAAGWGSELAAAGLTVDLAPVMDLVDGDPAGNPPIGAWDRQYGSTPDQVAAHANAFSEGLRSAGVAVAIKHFPGLGRVGANTDTAAGVADAVTTRDDPSVGVFAAGIRGGAEMVMVSSAIYQRIDPDVPAVFSPVVVDGMLRGDLGFDGVILTDDLSAAAQVQAWSPGERAVRAIDAGCDLVLASADPDVAAQMVDAVVARARQDADFAGRVHDAAARVLALKASLPPGPDGAGDPARGARASHR